MDLTNTEVEAQDGTVDASNGLYQDSQMERTANTEEANPVTMNGQELGPEESANAGEATESAGVFDAASAVAEEEATMTETSADSMILAVGGGSHQAMSDSTKERLKLMSQLNAKSLEIDTLNDTLKKQVAEIKRLRNAIAKVQGSVHDFAPVSAAKPLALQVAAVGLPGRSTGREAKWKARYQELVAFKLQHGHTNVPKGYKDKSLHAWVRKQRVCKKAMDTGLPAEGMNEQRVEALNNLGFQWVVGHQSKDDQWKAMFDELIEYKSRQGHMNIPATHPGKLRKWVHNQRARRRLLEQKGEGRAKGMTWQRVEQLDAIGFIWDGKSAAGILGGGGAAAVIANAVTQTAQGQILTIQNPGMQTPGMQTQQGEGTGVAQFQQQAYGLMAPTQEQIQQHQVVQHVTDQQQPQQEQTVPQQQQQQRMGDGSRFQLLLPQQGVNEVRMPSAHV